MHLVSVEYNQRVQFGVLHDKQVYLPCLDSAWDPTITSMLSLIDAGESAIEKLRALNAAIDDKSLISIEKMRWLSPIPRPRQNIMCLGLNYVDHVEETSQAKQQEVKLPRSPIVFTKAANSMNGPFDDIAIDLNVSAKMDWEAELGVVLGKTGTSIPISNALDYVFGYTVINDVTARDRQKWHKQFFIGKSFTGSCPMGPVIVTADEIDDPQNLRLRSWVNGQIKQDSNTKYQIFDIANVISVLSQGMQLEAGDIIATGTPSGVGYARTPPEYLMPGDVVECEVEQIGRIKNRITNK
jgi:2-keto-4-pentenoate hydratase/2-oxohepta-3-ene-1,7-dioic acid hydratase in catechol pathway